MSQAGAQEMSVVWLVTLRQDWTVQRSAQISKLPASDGTEGGTPHPFRCALRRVVSPDAHAGSASSSSTSSGGSIWLGSPSSSVGGEVTGKIWEVELSNSTSDMPVVRGSSVLHSLGRFHSLFGDRRYADEMAVLGRLSDGRTHAMAMIINGNFYAGWRIDYRPELWVVFIKDGVAIQEVDSKQRFSSDINEVHLASLGRVRGEHVFTLAAGDPEREIVVDGEERQVGAVQLIDVFVENGTVARTHDLRDGQGPFHARVAPWDRFGSSVASLGRIHPTATVSLAVGAPRDGYGVVWILHLQGTDLNVTSYVRIADGEGGFSGLQSRPTRFGTHIAHLGSVAGSVNTAIVVSAQVWF